jgi:hypothetical protein
MGSTTKHRAVALMAAAYRVSIKVADRPMTSTHRAGLTSGYVLHWSSS